MGTLDRSSRLGGGEAAPGAAGTRRERREELVRRVEYSPFPRVSARQRTRFGFTRDVSPSGLCLRVDAAEPTGSLLRVVLRDVDGRPTLESVARVAWRQPTVDGAWWIGLGLVDGRPPRAVGPRAARAAGLGDAA